MQKSRKRIAIGWRSYVLSLIIAILVGASALLEPIDSFIELTTGKFAWRSVSGETIAITVDDETLRRLDRTELTLEEHSRILDAARHAGLERIFVDFQYNRFEKNPNFPQLVSSVDAWDDRIALSVEANTVVPGENRLEGINWPSEKFSKRAIRACVCWEYMFWQVWEVPYAVDAGTRVIPTFSSLIARLPLQSPSQYPVDYSYLPSSIVKINAIDLLEGKFASNALRGKDAVFGFYTSNSSDQHYFPGHGRTPGADIHIMAGETLKRGNPIQLYWMPSFLLVVAVTLALFLRKKTRRFLIIAACIGAALIITKFLLLQILVHIKIAPSLVLLATFSIQMILVRRKWAAQQHNPISGLPNFNALRQNDSFGQRSIVAAKIVNFDEITTYLSSDYGQRLIEQIARRLQIGSADTSLYHDADGSFAWLSPIQKTTEIEAQLAGLAALFHTPIIIDDRRIDVNIAFGINDETEGSNSQRLAAARGAVDRAVRNRNLFERHTSSQDDDAAWKLSFQSQLKDALSNGDFWVAFQPQFDMASGQMVGVEALARWTHPSRGPIPPDQFIVQAEKSQDIYRLTLFVMKRSIQCGAQLHAAGHPLAVSVNLSAALLDQADLAATIVTMLDDHSFPASKLTIEITETAQFEDSRQAMQTLATLRQYGIRLSIDDYGTGQSNLEYFTRIEADEIKIDKSFVKTMRDSQRNFEIVKSTIELAHRLGAVAVAEGIEDQETLTLLRNLGCDVAQGYHLGKPQLFFEIMASLDSLHPPLSA
ncbi:EAL domain-containing protein [Sphingopyxis yananensis]|uniref:EAL domain-containing protein n=1 Tax=Sphingopyxis yananensis TaxID=2886687 RepID=UPI001D0FA361|nr:EAL domain-containing protein [Sphingopyxis yananensis]MCC2601931.1 EAL domain-containing protein [Sphingopyxis yananensis]